MNVLYTHTLESLYSHFIKPFESNFCLLRVMDELSRKVIVMKVIRKCAHLENGIPHTFPNVRAMYIHVCIKCTSKYEL